MSDKNTYVLKRIKKAPPIIKHDEKNDCLS